MNNEISLTYFAKITKEDDGYIVTFRDFDNIFSEGDDLITCKQNAQEALDGTLMAMIEEDLEIPLPSKKHKGEYPIPVSPEISAPVLLHILRNARSQTMNQVAKTMKVPYQQYQRLENNCNMTLKSFKRAASALGAWVEVKLHY